MWKLIDSEMISQELKIGHIISNDASQLEFSQGAIHGWPGCSKGLDKFRLARKALAGCILAGNYCISKGLANSLVLRKQCFSWHNLIIQIKPIRCNQFIVDNFSSQGYIASAIGFSCLFI